MSALPGVTQIVGLPVLVDPVNWRGHSVPLPDEHDPGGGVLAGEVGHALFEGGEAAVMAAGEGEEMGVAHLAVPHETGGVDEAAVGGGDWGRCRPPRFGGLVVGESPRARRAPRPG